MKVRVHGFESVSQKRWRRAQRYERTYQERKAKALAGGERLLVAQKMSGGRELRDRLSRFLNFSPSSRILEVGSGPHGISFFLAEGSRYSLDPLAVFYNRAFKAIQSGSGSKVVCAQGESIPFPGASFDLVITSNVLDHTMTPKKVLGEIHRVLRKDGVLYLGVNVCLFRGSMLSKIHELVVAPWFVLSAFGPHPFCFQAKDILNLLQDQGFQIRETASVPHYTEKDPDKSFLQNGKQKLIQWFVGAQYLRIICLKS